MQTVEWGHCSHRDYMQQPFFSTGFQLSSFFIPKAQPLSVELRSRKFYHFSGWILGLFHFLPPYYFMYHGELMEVRSHREEIITSTLPVILDLQPPRLREHGRGHTETVRTQRGRNRKGPRANPPPPPPRILRSRGNTARPRRREASRESMRFDGKQFERRTEWQELATRLMACCPRAPTPPMNASVRYQS